MVGKLRPDEPDTRLSGQSITEADVSAATGSGTLTAPVALAAILNLCRPTNLIINKLVQALLSVLHVKDKRVADSVLVIGDELLLLSPITLSKAITDDIGESKDEVNPLTNGMSSELISTLS